MGKSSLEQKIKNRLSGHEVHVDKNELWNRLGIEEDERDRKGVWIWWTRGLILLAFLAGAWLIIPNTKSPEVKTSENAIAKNNETTIDENLRKTGNEQPATNEITHQLATIIQEETSSNNEELSIPSKTTNRNNDILISDRQNNNTKKTIKNESNTSESVEKNTTLISPAQTKAIDLDDANDSQVFALVEAGSINDESIKKTDVVPAEKQLFITSLQHEVSPLQYDRGIPILYLPEIPKIKPVQIKSGMFAWSVYSGIAQSKREISSLTDDYLKYQEYRNTKESQLEHIQIGTSLTYNTRHGFYAKLGIQLNRWNEKFEYNILNDTIQEWIETPKVITISLTGDSTFQNEEFLQTQISSEDWKRYNRLTQIDLPVSFGYELDRGKWSAFGEVTAYINLNQTFKGYLANSAGEIIQNPDFFKSNIGVNFGGGLGIGYHFAPKWSARLSGQYYKLNRNILNDRSGLDQRNSSIGLRFSITREF